MGRLNSINKKFKANFSFNFVTSDKDVKYNIYSHFNDIFFLPQEMGEIVDITASLLLVPSVVSFEVSH